MATDTKGKKNKKKKHRKVAQGFSIDDVLAVGGDKDDFDMLKDVDALEGLNTDNKVKGSEQIRKDEVLTMIKELGLDKVISETQDIEGDVEDIEQSDDEEPNSQSLQEADTSVKQDTENKKEIKEKKKDKNETRKENNAKANKNKNELKTNEIREKEAEKANEQANDETIELQNKLLIKPGGKWYDQILEDDPSESKPLPSDITRLQKQAMDLWQNECDLYQKIKDKHSSSESKWMKTVVSSGTLGDKIAALTLQVQESPVHQIKALEVLVAMAKKKGRRESTMAIETLKELWLADLLLENRKLKAFTQQPLAILDAKNKNKITKEARQTRLVLWCYEDMLKQRFKEFVQALEHHLQDTIANIRGKALGIVYELLSQTPEQEQLLLKFLVNKVGDPERTIASKSSHLLRLLVTKHPNMKTVIVKEVEMLLYRPNISTKAQYYAVCFLNQIILNSKDNELASKLIAIYFSFFKVFVKNSDIEAKMLSALLTGVNRAFPFAKDDEGKYRDQLDMLFKVVHVGSFNASIQALMLLLQVMDVRQSISDRYYTALYSKLLDPALGTSAKQAMFLNTVYKSLKMDTSLQRVKAFVKRLLQVCSGQQPTFICGVLYLISELTKLKPAIKSMIQQPEEEDDEEHFEDIPDEEDETEHSTDVNDNQLDGSSGETKDSKESTTLETKHKHYDIKARNPLYCGAEGSCLWEITELFDHYHPSVCHFANLLSQGDEIVYKGDPLQDFTLMRFLDRFIYKNPKKKVTDHGGSLMQPSKLSTRLKEAPVNSSAFVNKKVEDVREDEMFFYRYFKSKAEHDKKKKKKDKEDEDEESDHEETEEDQEHLDLDFASEVKISKKENKKRKGKKDDDDDEEEGEDDSSGDEGGDFDYEDMDLNEDDDDDDEDLKQGTKRKFTDQDYEKALLENISSDELESDDEATGKSKKKKKVEGNDDVMSLFVSADEFSHLLENSSSGGSHDVSQGHASNKQISWEQRDDWSHKRQNKSSRDRGVGRGRGSGMGRGRGRGRGRVENHSNKSKGPGGNRGGRGRRGGRGGRR